MYSSKKKWAEPYRLKAFDQALILNLTFAFAAVPTFAATGARDVLEVQPREYAPVHRTQIKGGKNGAPIEITTDSPEAIQKMAASMRKQFLRNHHTATFKPTGESWTLVDQTANKTWIFRSRHASAPKPDLSGQLALAALYPKNVSVLSSTSRLCEAEKNWPLALEYYRKAFILTPPADTLENLVNPPDPERGDATRTANCAYFELMMGHYQTAVKELSHCIELDPGYAANYKNRAEAYRRLHKLDLAAADEKKLNDLRAQGKLSGHPVFDDKGSRSSYSANSHAAASHTDFRQSLSPLVLADLNLYEDAIKSSEALLKSEPKSGPALLARAKARLRLGRYQDAVADFKTLLSIYNGAHIVKAALEGAENLVKSGPPPYGNLSLLKTADAAVGQDAKPAADSSLHGASRSGAFHHHGEGRFPHVEPLQLAADHKGDYRVYWAIARAEQTKAHTDRTLYKSLAAEAAKMLLINPEAAPALAYKIEADQATFNWAEVEKDCNRYIFLLSADKVRLFDSDYAAYIYTVRGLARRAQKNFVGALADCDTAIKLQPDVPQVFVDRGDCYMQSGKYELALADYTKAVQIDDTKSGDIYLHRAGAYEKMKKPELAKQDRDAAAKFSADTGPQPVLPD